MRFHSLKRLSCNLVSNCSIVIPSAPAAPPLLFTFNHAAQISRLGMSCDLPDNLGSLMRLLPSLVDHTHQPGRPHPFAPPPTAIRRQITATTGESASAPRIGTQLLTDS